MDRRDQTDSQHQDRHDALDREAKALADEHQIQLLQSRLLVCLTDFSCKLEDAGEDDARELAFLLARAVLSAIGGEKGVDFLERTADPLALERRIRMLAFLCSEYSPRYTADDFRDHLQQFLAFQAQIESSLIATGLPPRMYSESPYLFLHFGRLYDTRCTNSQYPRGACEFSSDDDAPPYTWVKYQADNETVDGRQACEYAEADVLSGMTPADAERLETERAGFLTARRAVIQELLASCQQRNPEHLFKRCLETLEQNLTRDTISFLLRMDAFYLGGNAVARDYIDLSPKMSPGGVTNLLLVAGDVGYELRTERTRRMKTMLRDQFETVFTSEGVTTDIFGATEHYLAKCTAVPKLDDVLDQYARTTTTTWQQWWRTVGWQTAKWTAPDSHVTFSVEVPPEHAELLESQLPAILAILVTRADAGDIWAMQPIRETRNDRRADHGSQSLLDDRRLSLVLDDVGLKVWTIATNKDLGLEERLKLIACLDPRFFGKKSKELADLLGVTDGGIRQTVWWKEDRRRANEDDRSGSSMGSLDDLEDRERPAAYRKRKKDD